MDVNEEIKRKKNEWVVWEEAAAKRWRVLVKVYGKGIREEVMSVEWKKDYVGKSWRCKNRKGYQHERRL